VVISRGRATLLSYFADGLAALRYGARQPPFSKPFCGEKFSIDDPGSKGSRRSKRGCVMSGHSKWATIKHKKAATDAKRGRVFTRIIREISIAARIGGGDPNSNPRLRTAILAAKNENMPNDNIERAILRGTGQLEGEQYEEVTFEGYGPGGVGMLIQAVTTNRNRLVGEFRHLMTKNGGNLAEAGAVGWMFYRKGEITVPKEAASEDKLLDLVLDAGAEDLKDDGSSWYIVTPPEALEKVKEVLTKAGIKPVSAEIAMVPQNYIKLTGAQAVQMVRLVEALEEHDDVQHVYANFDIDESEIQAAVGAH
jgi:YebC/PmpR family DNA-binding regulatory protein